MKAKTKHHRKIFRRLAAVFSKLTPDEDKEIQDRVAKEIPLTIDSGSDETEAKQLALAYRYATELLYRKQCKLSKLC